MKVTYAGRSFDEFLLGNRKKASPPDMNFRGGERSGNEHLFDDESHGKAVAFVQCQSIRRNG